MKNQRIIRLGYDVPADNDGVPKRGRKKKEGDADLGYINEQAPAWEPRSAPDVDRIIAQVEKEPGVRIRIS